LGAQPVVDVFAHHVLGQTVTLLDLAFELVTLSVDLGEIVIGELAPLLFDRPCFQFPSMRFQSMSCSCPRLLRSSSAVVSITLPAAKSSALAEMRTRMEPDFSPMVLAVMV